jgi:hypothetical protein
MQSAEDLAKLSARHYMYLLASWVDLEYFCCVFAQHLWNEAWMN